MPLVTQKKWGSCFCISIRTPGIVCANSSTIIFWLSEAYNRNIEYKEIFDRIVLPPSTGTWVCESKKKRRVFAFGGGRRSNVECVRSATREESMGWEHETRKYILRENIIVEATAAAKKNTTREDDSKKKEASSRNDEEKKTRDIPKNCSSASVCSACREHHTREWEEGYMYVI